MKFCPETFSKQIDQFLSTLMVERNLSTNTLKAYSCDLNNLRFWFIENHEENLTHASILSYFSWLQREKNLHPKSIHRKYIALRQFFQFLNQEGYADETFFRFNSRRFQLPKNLPRTLSKLEIRALIQATENEYESLHSSYRRRICTRDMAIIELLFCLGLRISEITALLLEDFKADSQCLLIHGKGKKERILYISSFAVLKKLQNWISVRPELSPACPNIFINKYGNSLSIYSIENIFKKYRDQAHINPHATPHYLRHSFASQLLNNGASIRDVQELLGHNSIITTQIYTEITIERKKEVMTKFNERNFLF